MNLQEICLLLQVRVLLFLLLLCAACTKTDVSKNSLRISFNAKPATLIPNEAGDFISSTLVCMLYEGLTRCLPGGEPELALAEKIELSKDQKTYTFHLRNAYWSDGEPITAYDFEISWKAILSPPQICAQLFYPIQNAEKCVRGSCPIEKVGIRALDAKTLIVALEYPTPYFTSLVAFPAFLPAPSHTKEPIFSGPFLLKTQTLSSLLLTKNPHFWNEKAISLDQIEVRIVEDEIAALQLFERGDLDWVGGPLSPLPPDALEHLRDSLSFVPSAATTFCAFNTEKEPFNDPEIRRAFSYAIDRHEIVNKVTQTGQVAAESILPPPFARHYVELTNAEKARECFGEKKIGPVTLYFRTGQIEKLLAQVLQKQWETVLPVKINLVQLDAKSHMNALQRREYEISLTSWIAQFDDPASILDRFKDKNCLKNYPGWHNPQYAKLLDEAREAKQRGEFLEKAEKLLAEELPLTPIYHWNSPVLIGPRVHSTATTPCGGVLFERFEMKQ